MNVSDAWRDGQSIWAEHRHDVQVLSTILDNHHSPGGERFSASGGSITILPGGSLPLARGTTGAGRQMSVAFCAIALTEHNTMAASDSGDVTFKLVHFRFAIFFPLMRSPKSILPRHNVVQ